MSLLEHIQNECKKGLSHVDSKDQLNQMVLNRSNKGYEKRNRKNSSLKDLKSLKNHQAWTTESLLLALGGLPQTSTQLNVQSIAIEQRHYYTLEKVIYESLPKVYVTANIYKPTFIEDEKLPAILLACGHQKLGKHSEEYQYVAQTLVSYGFIVMVIDNFGQGERYSYLQDDQLLVDVLTFEHDHAGYQSSLLGDNIARYMIHDHIRAMDYLIQRADVDSHKIGITGNSGGGTLSALLMVLENRIAAAAPATFITRRDIYQKTGQPQDREQHWFKLTELGFDHEDLLMAFAPKPVHLLIADYDFFPLEGTLKTINLAQKAYDTLEQSHNLSYTRFAIEHSYPVEMAQKAAEFFQSVFQSSNHQTFELKLDEACICTKTGQVKTNFKDARFVYDLNLERYEELKRLTPTYRKDQHLRRYVETMVFSHRSFTEFISKRLSIVETQNGYSIEHWTYQTQVDMASSLLWFKRKSPSTSLVLALWPKSCEDIASHEAFIQKCIQEEKDVLVLDLSGEGYLQQRDLIWWAKADESYGSLYKLNDDLFWLGDSLAALRSYEVYQALTWIQTQSSLKIEVHAFKTHSVYAFVANYLYPQDLEVIEHEGFKGYVDWLKTWVYEERLGWELLFPSLLKYGDLSDLKTKEKI